MLPNKRALLLELKPHAEQCNPGPEQLRSCGYLGLWMSYYVFIYIMSESWTPSLCSLCFYSFLPFFFSFLGSGNLQHKPSCKNDFTCKLTRSRQTTVGCGRIFAVAASTWRTGLPMPGHFWTYLRSCTMIAEPGTHSVAIYDFMENSVTDSCMKRYWSNGTSSSI